VEKSNKGRGVGGRPPGGEKSVGFQKRQKEVGARLEKQKTLGTGKIRRGSRKEETTSPLKKSEEKDVPGGKNLEEKSTINDCMRGDLDTENGAQALEIEGDGVTHARKEWRRRV